MAVSSACVGKTGIQWKMWTLKFCFSMKSVAIKSLAVTDFPGGWKVWV